MGLVHTFLSEGEFRDVAGGVRLEFGTGVLISTKERREVLGRLRGGGAALLRSSGSNAGGGESFCPRRRHHGLPLRSVIRNKIRRQMCMQRYVLFRGPTSKVWGCRARPNGIL